MASYTSYYSDSDVGAFLSVGAAVLIRYENGGCVCVAKQTPVRMLHM